MGTNHGESKNINEYNFFFTTRIYVLIQKHVFDDSKPLQALNVPVYNHSKCKVDYKLSFPINENMICAGYDKKNRNTCNGDSGGPLVVGDFLIGVVSWGPTICGESNSPGVYARVASARQWITEKTGL